MHYLPYVTKQNTARRKILDRRDSSQLTHRVLGFVVFRIEDHRRLPEAERTVFLERSHVAENAFVEKEGHAPLHCLLDLRAALVNDGPKFAENGFGKIGRLVDVGVNTLIFGGHGTIFLSILRIGAIPKSCTGR